MAHVGKFYPIAMRRDMSPFGSINDSPPYRIHLITGPSSTGVLCTAWRNKDLISEAPTVEPSDGSMNYLVQHPTVPSGSIRLRWLTLGGHQGGSTSDLTTVNFFVEFWQGGAQLATFTTNGFVFDIITGTLRNILQFTTWTTSTNRALVNTQTDLRICAARWSDVPDYHPRQPAHA